MKTSRENEKCTQEDPHRHIYNEGHMMMVIEGIFVVI